MSNYLINSLKFEKIFFKLKIFFLFIVIVLLLWNYTYNDINKNIKNYDNIITIDISDEMDENSIELSKKIATEFVKKTKTTVGINLLDNIVWYYIPPTNDREELIKKISYINTNMIVEKKADLFVDKISSLSENTNQGNLKNLVFLYKFPTKKYEEKLCKKSTYFILFDKNTFLPKGCNGQIISDESQFDLGKVDL